MQLRVKLVNGLSWLLFPNALLQCAHANYPAATTLRQPGARGLYRVFEARRLGRCRIAYPLLRKGSGQWYAGWHGWGNDHFALGVLFRLY